MKTSSLILGAVLLLTTACKKNDIPDGTPDCIVSRIEQIKDQQAQSPPMRVIEYEYDGRTVYYIPASEACCDIVSELWDRQCNLLCHPDEPWLNAAPNDSCPDFHQLKTAGKVLWEDDRKD